MEKWAGEKAVGNRDQKENVGDGEEGDRVCQECYDARRGTIEIL